MFVLPHFLPSFVFFSLSGFESILILQLVVQCLHPHNPAEEKVEGLSVMGSLIDRTI